MAALLEQERANLKVNQQDLIIILGWFGYGETFTGRWYKIDGMILSLQLASQEIQLVKFVLISRMTMDSK
jgi:hypothetical protein